MKDEPPYVNGGNTVALPSLLAYKLDMNGSGLVNVETLFRRAAGELVASSRSRSIAGSERMDGHVAAGAEIVLACGFTPLVAPLNGGVIVQYLAKQYTACVKVRACRPLFLSSFISTTRPTCSYYITNEAMQFKATLLSPPSSPHFAGLYAARSRL